MQKWLVHLKKIVGTSAEAHKHQAYKEKANGQALYIRCIRAARV